MIRQGLMLFFLALTVGGFLLIWDSPPEAFLRQTSSPLEKDPQADSYMIGVTSQRFSELGNPQFNLSSPRVEFFEGESSFMLEQPQFSAQNDISHPLRLRAAHGQLDNANKQLNLRGNVRAEITTEDGPALLTTEQLSYLIDSNIASTGQPFNLVTAQSDVAGTGLRADLNNETFVIQSKVKITHEPR